MTLSQLLDILVINETKLNDLVDSSCFESLDYNVLRRDRLRKNGDGNFVFIKKSLNRSDLINDYENDNEIISFIVNFSDTRQLGLLQLIDLRVNKNETNFFETI